MNAFVATKDGLVRGTVTRMSQVFGQTAAQVDVMVGNNTEHFTPNQFHAIDGLFKSEITNVAFPAVFVSKKDFRTIAAGQPKTRKPRAKKSK